MRKRLVWNFEIIPKPLLDLPETPPNAVKGSRWELRYFWPEQTIIPLFGLPDTFLSLSRSKVKRREDTYCLLPNQSYNLKLRRGKWLYKPSIHQNGLPLAFGKKIDLAQHPECTPLPGEPPITVAALREQIHTQGTLINVTKEALIYKLTPSIQLELARLQVMNTVYFSVCIESRVESQLERIANSLLGQQAPCDYVTFLKQIEAEIR